MNLVRIINKSQAAVVLEDIGVRLAPGSSQVVSQASLSQSKDLIRMSKFIRVENLSAPVLQSRPAVIPPIPVSVTVPAPFPLPSSDPVVHTIIEREKVIERVVENPLQKTMDVISSTLSTLVDEVRSRPVGVQVGVKSPVDSKVDEYIPMFIPSKVIPDIEAVNLKSKEESADSSGVDDAAQALAKLRKTKSG